MLRALTHIKSLWERFHQIWTAHEADSSRGVPINTPCAMGSGNSQAIEPYLDQVSGHSCLFHHEDSGVVFKPLYQRELHFYEHMPADMRDFTPAYYGMAEVRFQHEDNDQVTFVANKDPTNLHQYKLKDRKARLCIRWLNKSKLEVTVLEDEHCALELISSPEGSTDVQSNRVLWNFKLLHKLLQTHSGRPQEFLVLENLTHGLRHPCVMDIKMGTRQHSDDATEQKRMNQIRKCQNTTSASLGVRICGMKVYRVDGPHTIWCDKYYGRTLDASGVENILQKFLNNGQNFRYDVASQILDKLKHVLTVISDMDGIRFYSSSLLITYEGSEVSEHAHCSDDFHIDPVVNNNAHINNATCTAYMNSIPKVNVHLVDFELVTQNANSASDIFGPDQGMLLGLRNLIQIFQHLIQAPNTNLS